jgi:SAM-dependent methyltransferase
METAYVHGTQPKEQERLAGLNDITNRSFIAYLGDCAGLEMCDFGCGLGKLMLDIARQYPTARLTGLDISEAQLAVARQNTAELSNLTLLQADGCSTGLPDSCFDLTYGRYLLEHVQDPIGVAREMLRVTKPGGRVIVQENDLHNALFYPEIAGYPELKEAFCRLQILMGGDPYIGRKLFSILKQAGSKSVRLGYEPEFYTEDDAGYRGWVQNSLEILVGAKDRLIEKSLVSEKQFEAVRHRMQERIDRPEGVALFHWNRATAVK